VELERRVVPGFLAPRAFDAATRPDSVAVGDFKSDGLMDLAVANYGSGNVSVLLGNGDGTFQAPRNFAAGTDPISVVVGDFNGDGIPDLAIANYFTNNVSVLLGNGDGTFQAGRTFATVGAPLSIAVGDFNGDGQLDLVTTNLTFDNVSVLLGNGDGTFQAAHDFPAGSNPQSVAVGDFNGDGRLDLAVADYVFGNCSVSVLLGNGDGTFQAGRTFPAGVGFGSVAVGDLNGDGVPDLAVADSGDPLGRTSGVSVLLGNGDGSFQAARAFAAGSSPQSVALGDFNGDDRLDLAVANDFSGGGSVSVLVGNGDGTFQPPRSFTTGVDPASVAVADLNGDGRLDLAIADSGGRFGVGSAVTVLLGNGDGTFQASPTFAAGSGPLSVAVGDFTGDGRLDLAVANDFSDDVSVLLGNGDGTFQAQRTFATGSGSYSVAVGDFTGDGRLDLAVANYFSNNVSVLLGNGDGSFQDARTFAAGPNPRALAVGDFTGDGIPDLAVANDPYSGNGSGVSLLLGNGDGSFQTPRTFAAGPRPVSVAVGDFNRDGRLDLVVANYRGNNVSVLLGNGDGSFQTARTFAAGSNPVSVAVGDFSGDGIPNLVVANEIPSNGTVSVLQGNGDGSFQAGRTFAAGSDPQSVAVGDFSRDGRLDLAVANYRGNNVSVLLGNGDGSFQTANFSYSAGSRPYSVAVGDFNGDGYPDLAVANFYSNDVSILLNDRHWRRHPPPTRSPLPAAQPVAGGVGGVEPQALRQPATVLEAPLAEPAFDLPAAAFAGPVADPPPAPPQPQIVKPESVATPISSPGPEESAPQPNPLPPALALPRPIRDSVFAPALATGIDGNLVDDRNSLLA
jgi:hypothetical protein